MEELKYYLQKSPRGGAYHARTIVTGKYGKAGFINKMLQDNPNLKREEVERVLTQAKATFESVMEEGASLVIADLFRVAPVVKGSFKNEKEPFSAKKHFVQPALSFSRSFVKRFKGRMKARRVNKPPKGPYLTQISNNRGEKGFLHRALVNNISGAFLNERGHRFVALTISANIGEGEKVRLDVGDMDLVSHTAGEIRLGLGPYFEVPAWLTDGRKVSIKLLYLQIAGDIEYETLPFRVVWKDR